MATGTTRRLRADLMEPQQPSAPMLAIVHGLLAAACCHVIDVIQAARMQLALHVPGLCNNTAWEQNFSELNESDRAGTNPTLHVHPHTTELKSQPLQKRHPEPSAKPKPTEAKASTNAETKQESAKSTPKQTWNCLTKYRCNRIMKWQTMNAETNTKTNAAPPRQPSKPKPLPNPTPWQKHERGLRGCCYRAVCIQKLKNNRKQRLTTQCETHTYAHRVKVESFPGITPPSHVLLLFHKP
jgi:hypothetical protein